VERLGKDVEVFRKMENMSFRPNIASSNTLIAENCSKGLLSFAIKLKNTMKKNELHMDVVTFKTIIHEFCKEDELHEDNEVFIEMNAMNYM
jgi:hypothetical protein